MYLLAVHTPFLTQIIRTEQDWYEKFRADIFQDLSAHRFVYSRTKRDCWLFISSDIQHHDTRKITRVLDVLLECFHKWRYCVMGCFGLIDFAERESEEGFDYCIEQLLGIEAFNSVWISHRLGYMVYSSMQLSKLHNLYRYEHGRDGKSGLECLKCMHVDATVAKLGKALRRWSSQNRKSRAYFILVASKSSGIDIAFQKVFSQWNDPHHLVYFRNVERSASYAAIRGFFIQGDIEQYFTEDASHLLNHVQNVLERIHPTSMRNYSADEQGDIIAVFTIIVEHMLKKHTEETIYFVCEWMEDWNDFEYTTLFSVLDEVDKKRRIHCILVYGDVESMLSHKRVCYHFQGSFDYEAAYAHYGSTLTHKLKDILAIENLDPLPRFMLLIASQYGWVKNIPAIESKWSSLVFSRIPQQFLRVLYLLIKSHDILFSHELMELFAKEDISEGQFQHIVRRLAALRMLSGAEGLTPYAYVNAEDIRPFLKNRGPHLHKIFSQHMWQKIESGGMHPTENIYHSIVDWILPQQQLHLYLITCEHYLDTSNRFPNALFEELPCDVGSISDREKYTLTLARRIVTHEYHLITNKVIESALTEYLVDAGERKLPHWILPALYATLACAFCRCGEKKQATHYAKQVLMLKTAWPRARAHAFHTMATLMANLKRYAESESYYSFAIEESLKFHSYRIGFLATLRLSAQYFICGNFSAAASQLEHFLVHAGDIGQHEWTLAVLFVRARIYFEIGNYAEAHHHFSQCVARGGTLLRSNIGNIAVLWAARCKSYMQELGEALSGLEELSDSAEVLFVKSELAFFEGNLEEALKYIHNAESLLGQIQKVQFPYVMSTGYSFVEDFYEKEGSYVLGRYITVFRAYLLSQSGSLSQAEKVLQIYGSKLGGQEWGSVLYYYIGAIINRHGSSENGSGVNLVSKGVTLIKSYAKHLHGQNERKTYLYENYWNAKLMQLAKECYII